MKFLVDDIYILYLPIFDHFINHPSSHLNIAKTMANQVICLPLHHNMKEEHVEYIVSLIKA